MKSSSTRYRQVEPTEAAGFLAAWAGIAGLWSVAIAWPVYQNIASGPEALTGLGLRRPDLLILVVLVSIAAPTVLAGILVLTGRLAGDRSRRLVHAGVVGLLLALFVWQQVTGSAGLVRVAAPLLVAILVAWSFLRWEFVRSFVLILGIAVPVVIVMFTLRYPVWSEAGPHEPSASPGTLVADTPVVIVVFDELPLAALERRGNRIDRKLFPNFARLADSATSYPGMLAVADQTTYALPSILTGLAPDPGVTTEPPPPGLPDFPDNVCSLSESGGYDVRAYEPITDMCPRTFGMGSRVSAAIRRGAGATEESRDVRLAPQGLAADAANLLAEPFAQPWSEYGSDRDLAFDSFLERMPGTERSLSLLHIALPHVEWEYLPDGTRYLPGPSRGAASLVSRPTEGEVNRDMQQMMLQLAFTDRELGRLVEKMKAQGIWDSALLVVTADHGGGFVRGGSRRIISRDNAGWVVPVPLLIKYPGQAESRVVHGSADSFDIAPTVFDLLGIANPDGSEGDSLLGRSNLPEPRSADFHSSLGSIEVSPRRIRNQLDAARREKNHIFEDGFYAIGGHRELLGTDPGKNRRLTRLGFFDLSPGDLSDVDRGSPVLPAYFAAVIDPSVAVSEPLPAPGTAVAVALNDRVVATTRTWQTESGAEQRTGVVLPPGAFRDGSNRIQLYEIPGSSRPDATGKQ